MASVIESMLTRYNCKNVSDYRNALKEIAQEVALCGLSRGGFFEKAAFYGGTALRIFYGLDRFSEDMELGWFLTLRDRLLCPACESDF